MITYTSLTSIFLSLTTALVAAQTNLTGDILHGVPVINYLSLEDVPSNAVTRYYLRVPSVNGGWDVHLPVFVARGAPETLSTGKKLSVSASIHGDELNGVRVTQRLFEKLEHEIDSLNGTVIGIPTVNPVGNYLNQRNYFTAGNTGFFTNLNRVFPGDDPAEGALGPNGQAYLIWNNLWGNTSNVDVGIDLHTTSTGSEAPLYVYADIRLPYVERIANLLQPDILKIDAGEPGSIETTFVDYGIPAVTVEIGSAKVWRKDYIERTLDFFDRLLVDLALLPSNSSEPYTPDLSETYIGTVFHSLPALYGGFVETLVNVLDDVDQGQDIAIVRNAWGDILEIVKAPVAAKIHEIRTDPSIEPGRDVANLIYNSTAWPDCEAGCIVSSRKGPPAQ
ncbi:hypothetical protein M501DRAFT_939837 [Patellaria atrata CBS 101060]|uniref:Succinylglutamate desuccinylase/Aspartoacylase catalytic domain-containing protein n=1 Tax=Patellaria atrata CBS 101060 TaxID=1346257 RepID=A0A9P4S5N3_9PEZI|nr:hypothetical protein M501DRAFT_939837 [Patellaria atrata CBS 101060]